MCCTDYGLNVHNPQKLEIHQVCLCWGLWGLLHSSPNHNPQRLEIESLPLLGVVGPTTQPAKPQPRKAGNWPGNLRFPNFLLSGVVSGLRIRTVYRLCGLSPFFRLGALRISFTSARTLICPANLYNHLHQLTYMVMWWSMFENSWCRLV